MSVCFDVFKTSESSFQSNQLEQIRQLFTFLEVNE